MAGVNPQRFDYWWQAILALPPSRTDVAYKRLERIFRDQTRPSPLKPDPITGWRGHEFTDTSRETHLTVTLWENFVLFPPARWLPQLWGLAGLSASLQSVQRCNWSYEWAEHGNNGAHHCDIVLEYEDATGRGILVVEAKKPGARLTDKDCDPAYYLEIPQLASYGRRSLLYLIDDDARAKGGSGVQRGSYDVGFLSWEKLASLQIDCVDAIPDTPTAVRAYIAGSIYRQYSDRGITPGILPLSYLRDEPLAADVAAKRGGRLLGKGDWEEEIWRVSRLP